MGAGVIVRDHEGKLLASMCSSKPYIIDLMVTKALADGKQSNFVEIWIIIEGDTPEVVQALKNEERCQSWYGQIIFYFLFVWVVN